MTSGLEVLFWLALFGAVVLLWWYRSARREELTRIARRKCDELGLQLLDDTLSLASVRLVHVPQGWRLCWCYRFEFSATGSDRHQAELEQTGRRSLRFRLPPYPEPTAERPQPAGCGIRPQ